MAGANVRDIKVRIDSVKNTRQITKAMKMVAASKLRRSQEQIIAARPYANMIYDLLNRVATRIPDALDNPLFKKHKEIKKVALIVITGDRGLCGAFNGNVMKKAMAYLKTIHVDVEVDLIVIGKKGRDYFRRRPWPIKNEFVGVGMELPINFLSGLTASLAHDFTHGNYDEVYMFYNEFKSVIAHTTNQVKILPIEGKIIPDDAGEENAGKAKGALESIYVCEPSPEAVFASLLPKHLSIQLRRAVLESNASEQASRMTAMDAATGNASDMIDSLTLTYNQARQAAITAELLDIAGGAEALNA